MDSSAASPRYSYSEKNNRFSTLLSSLEILSSTERLVHASVSTGTHAQRRWHAWARENPSFHFGFATPGLPQALRVFHSVSWNRDRPQTGIQTGAYLVLQIIAQNGTRNWHSKLVLNYWLTRSLTTGSQGSQPLAQSDLNYWLKRSSTIRS